MRRAAKIDGNQRMIVDALRKAGCRVKLTSGDTIDAIVGCTHPRRIVLLEFKRDGKAKLTPAQVRFFEDWAGWPVYRINGIADAMMVCCDLP